MAARLGLSSALRGALLATLTCAAQPADAAPQFCPRGAQASVGTPTLQVGVKFAPPFAMERGERAWQGLAVDLWETIALCLGARFEYREYASVDELLSAVEKHEVDVAIGAIDIDAESERRVDFSHPFYQGSLGAIVSDGVPERGLAAALHGFARPGPLLVMLGLSLATLLVACIYWRVEGRRRDAGPGASPPRDFYNALIWATLLVFSGRGEPLEIRHRAVQLVTLFLTFFGVTVVSGVTAIITSTLTLQGLPTSLQTVADLKGREIAVMTTGRAREWSLRERLYVRQLRSWPEVQRGFDEKSLQTFLHDRETLQYLVKDGYLSNVRVEPLSFGTQGYGFAVAVGSPLRKPIDLALLAIQHDGVWDAMTGKYFGSR